jgi:Zn-dependent peptidase ImmA (M78 family)
MSRQVSKIIPHAEAARLWTLYGFSSPKDLVLEDLAMALGVYVIDGRLDSADARLVRSGDQGLIRVSDRLRHFGRRRFAIAHEIGHWVLHEHVTQMLACTEQDMLVGYKSSEYEVEASMFAGALLMPDKQFRAKADRSRPTTSVLEDLAGFFESSLTATALRYVETSRDYCVMILSEFGEIRWWRASEPFMDKGLWLRSRTELPRHSAAARYFADEEVPTEPIEVDLVDWLGRLSGIESDYVVEQAIPLDKYGQVISMLWLP